MYVCSENKQYQFIFRYRYSQHIYVHRFGLHLLSILLFFNRFSRCLFFVVYHKPILLSFLLILWYFFIVLIFYFLVGGCCWFLLVTCKLNLKLVFVFSFCAFFRCLGFFFGVSEGFKFSYFWRVCFYGPTSVPASCHEHLLLVVV